MKPVAAKSDIHSRSLRPHVAHRRARCTTCQRATSSAPKPTAYAPGFRLQLSGPTKGLPRGSFNKVVARTQGHTFAARVWAPCVIQGPFSVAPCLTLTVPIRNKQLTVRCDAAAGQDGAGERGGADGGAHLPPTDHRPPRGTPLPPLVYAPLRLSPDGGVAPTPPLPGSLES